MVEIFINGNTSEKLHMLKPYKVKLKNLKERIKKFRH